MPSTSRTRSRAATISAWSAAAATLLCLGSAPASAAPRSTPAPPQLSIAVDNGSDRAASGDELSYVITLTNVGTEDVSDLLVTQSLPPGTSLISADADGEKKKEGVEWEVDLEANEKTTFKTNVELADTPAEVLRLAIVACAKVSAKAAPVVCASDSDLLPAGEEAAKAEAAMTTETGVVDRRVWYLAAGTVLAAGLASLLVLRLRRRA
ncbi:hypothetical protein GCM10009616_04140 [Microlunatus lacustris]